MLVNLDDILVIDRGRKKYKNVDELAKSLIEHGQIQEIVVRPLREDEKALGHAQPWALVAGGRRYAAAIRAGWTELRAHKLGELPHWRQRALELEENVQREGMEFAEECEMKLQIHELYAKDAESRGEKWELKDTKHITGDSNATIGRDIKLAKAIRADPGLKLATSKKAALQQVELKELHIARTRHDTALDLSGLRERLYNGDARDFLRSRPTHSVDLSFTDLPWGISYYARYEGSESAPGTSEYDDSGEVTKDLITDVVPQLIRVTKPTGWLAIVMNWENHFFLKDAIESCCAEHFEYRAVKDDGTIAEICRASWGKTDQSPCRWLSCEKIPWIWYRPNSRNNPRFPMRNAQNQYELILVCNMGDGKIYTGTKTPNVKVADAVYGDRHHAMQKPEKLCDEIITDLTLPGMVVLDCTMGSGAHLYSAAKLGRKFYGCELNPNEFELALAHISKVYKGELPAMTQPRSPEDEVERELEEFDEELGIELDEDVDEDEIEELDFETELREDGLIDDDE